VSNTEVCEHGVEGFCMLCCRAGEGKPAAEFATRDNKCGACSEGRHQDCSNWCFCDCEFNR
jgi:hypothetical protein